MFKLSSDIQFSSAAGRIGFSYVGSVEINTSIDTLADTAVVRLPKKLLWKDKGLRDMIRREDPVSISLGYDGINTPLFDGYIRSITRGVPLEITCEDQMMKLKKVKCPAKIYKDLTIEKLCLEFCPIEYKVADAKLGTFKIGHEVSFAKVLDTIRSEYGFQFFIRDGKLYGTLPSMLLARDTGFVNHNFATGTAQANANFDSLEYLTTEDINIIIKAKTVLKNNKKLEVIVPKNALNGEIRTFHCGHAQTLDELRAFANEKLKTFKVDQMKGSFMAMGQPLVKKGDSVTLKDGRNPDWSGRQFLVKSVQYLFNTEGKGFAQKIELGYQLS